MISRLSVAIVRSNRKSSLCRRATRLRITNNNKYSPNLPVRKSSIDATKANQRGFEAASETQVTKSSTRPLNRRLVLRLQRIFYDLFYAKLNYRLKRPIKNISDSFFPKIRRNPGGVTTLKGSSRCHSRPNRPGKNLPLASIDEGPSGLPKAHRHCHCHTATRSYLYMRLFGQYYSTSLSLSYDCMENDTGSRNGLRNATYWS